MNIGPCSCGPDSLGHCDYPDCEAGRAVGVKMVRVPVAQMAFKLEQGESLSRDECLALVAAVEHLRDMREKERELLWEAVVSLVGLFDPYGRGRPNEPESQCADVIARANEVLDEIDRQLAAEIPTPYAVKGKAPPLTEGQRAILDKIRP